MQMKGPNSSASVRQRRFQRHKYSMDFFRLKTLKSHTNAHAVRDRPSLKDVTHFISIKVLKRYATCLLERCP